MEVGEEDVEEGEEPSGERMLVKINRTSNNKLQGLSSVEQTRGQCQTGRNDLPGRVRELLNGW